MRAGLIISLLLLADFLLKLYQLSLLLLVNTMVSLPVKLLLFDWLGGWEQLFETLVQSLNLM